MWLAGCKGCPRGGQVCGADNSGFGRAATEDAGLIPWEFQSINGPAQRQKKRGVALFSHPLVTRLTDKWFIIINGGVGERLKPAVLKNKIADSLSGRKFN